jgi:hypothetical protein
MTLKTTARILAAGAALAAAAPDARACSVCGCGDPLLSASDPAAITGQLRLQIDTEYLRVDAGTEGNDAATDKLTQWSYRVNAVYRPFEALSLTATVPLVSKSIRTVDAASSTTMSSLSGLGDVELGARYAVWTQVNVGARRVQELALSAGTTLPTGKKDAFTTDPVSQMRLLIDPHGQVGTGGWSPFAGAHYRYEEGDWLGFASASYRIRTEASYFDSSKYKFGDALLWSVHGQYRPLRRLALDLGLDGRYAKADSATVLSDVPRKGLVRVPAVDNTGGTVLSLAPGVYYNAVGGLWLFVRGQVPVYKDLFGRQDVLPSATTGFQFQAF